MHKVTKKFLYLATTALLVGLPVSTLAADFHSTKSAPATFSSPIWTGFYAGMNAGYNFGTNNNVISESFSQTANINVSPDPAKILYTPQVTGVGQAQSGQFGILQSGFIGGGQIGYNLELSQQILLGMETDIQTSSVRGTAQEIGAGYNGYPWTFLFTHPALTVFNPIGNTTITSGVDWLGTLRARFGYLISPSLLIYGTGGLSYGGGYGDYYNSVIANHIGFGTPDVNDPYNHVWVGNGHANQFLLGWNGGAGLEWMFAPQWSLKTEAIYWNLGNQNILTNTVDPPPIPIPSANSSGWVLPMATVGRAQINYQGIITRIGLNYHFNSNQKDDAVSGIINDNLSSNPNDRWSGLYFGFNGGYSFGTNKPTSSQNWGLVPWQTTAGNIAIAAPFSMSGTTANNVSGGMAGALIGINIPVKEKFITGIEADILSGDLRNGSLINNTGPIGFIKSNNAIGNQSVDSGIDFLGSLRGRFGYLFFPSLLIYGTGGLTYGKAYANVNQNAVESFSVSGTGWTQTWIGYGSKSSMLTGWNVGGGIEWLVMPDWSVKTEVAYWNIGQLNTSTNAFSPTSHSSSISNNNMIWGNTAVNFQGILAKAGINYHLNLAPAPVVAKY